LVDFERQTIWRFAVELYTQHSWFGLGANTINLQPGADVVIPFSNDTHQMPSHPHNWLLELLVETGTIGVVAYAALMAAVTWRLIDAYRQTSSRATLGAVAIIGGYLISGLFNFSFWAAWWQISFLLFAAISLAAGASQVSRN
jgi:O-antigen ligase